MNTTKTNRSFPVIIILVFLSVLIPKFCQSQCTVCNSTITANSGAITVPNNQTYCIKSPAIPGDITISGTITLGSNSSVCVLATNGDIIINGNISFSAGATFNSYSTNPTDTIKFKGLFLDPTGPAGNLGYFNNYGTLLVNPPTVGGTISFPPKILYTNAGNMILNSTFSSNSNSITNTGVMDIVGKANFLAGVINNSGTINADYPLGAAGDKGLIIGGTMTNTGTINTVGHLEVTTSGGLTNSSTGYIHTGGNLSINGTFNNYNMVDVDAALILNSGTGIDISNGSFRSYDLYIQKGGITATGGTCASFLVTNHSEVSSSPTFTGTVYIQDLSNASDTIDLNNGCGSCNFTSGNGTGTCPNEFLPITLLQFYAVKHADKIVLNWATSIEINNDHFVIEKSGNGISFEPIGSVEGFAFSEQVKKYQFEDNKRDNSIAYYRLKQIDSDGKFSYSGIIKVVTAKVDICFSPNPTNEGTTLILQVQHDDVLYFSFFNQMGSKVFESQADLRSGENKLNLSTEFFDPGNYMFVGHTKSGERLFNSLLVY